MSRQKKEKKPINNDNQEKKLVRNIFIAALRSPFKVEKGDDGKMVYTPTHGGVSTVIKGLREGSPKSSSKNDQKPMRILTFAYPGDVSDKKDEPEIIKVLQKKGVVPVFIAKKTYGPMYEGFANGLLWPWFHLVNVNGEIKEIFELPTDSLDREWDAYVKSNKLFGDSIIEELQALPKEEREKTIVWINDYQLMLVPGIIKDALPDINVRYFHHIPWPVKTFAEKMNKKYLEPITTSLLKADGIGFHCEEYQKNFCEMVDELGLDTGLSSEQVKNKSFVAPIGIQFKRFAEYTNVSDALNNFNKKLREEEEWTDDVEDTIESTLDLLRMIEKPEYTIISAVDRIDPSKGFGLRLDGFKELLERRSELKGEKPVLVMVMPKSREGVSAYEKEIARVYQRIDDINNEFKDELGYTPILPIKQSVDSKVIQAIYQVSKIQVSTSKRDGFHLGPPEFLISLFSHCKTDDPLTAATMLQWLKEEKSKLGTCVMSRGIGAAHAPTAFREPGNAVIFDPFEEHGFCDALIEALTSIRENPNMVRAGMGKMQEWVIEHDDFYWALCCLFGTKRVEKLDEALVDALKEAASQQVGMLEIENDGGRFSDESKREELTPPPSPNVTPISSPNVTPPPSPGKEPQPSPKNHPGYTDVLVDALRNGVDPDQTTKFVQTNATCSTLIHSLSHQELSIRNGSNFCGVANSTASFFRDPNDDANVVKVTAQSRRSISR